MRKRWLWMVLGVCLAGAAWFGYGARRAGRDRVTLDFREAEVGEVARAIERQTWEKVLVQPGVTRKITVQVQDVPLGRALEVLAGQAECEWTRVVALYRTRVSLGKLESRIVAGASGGTWTNYPAGSLRRPGFVPFEPGESGVELVNYSAAKKPATRIASELSRFGKVLVVLEDGVDRPASLEVREGTTMEAAERLARELGLKSASFYVLRPLFKEKRRPELPPPDLQMRALPEEVRKAFEAGKPVQIRFEAKEGAPPGMELLPPGEDMLAAPPPPPMNPEVERQRLQQKTVEEIRNSTPEQRLERLRQSRGAR